MIQHANLDLLGVGDGAWRPRRAGAANVTLPKSLSAIQCKLAMEFEAVCSTLRGPEFADRGGRPLAYWTLGEDRRLPLVFLRRAVSEVIETPFVQVAATPGVGPKKIAALIRLLQRVIQQAPPESRPEDTPDGAATRGANRPAAQSNGASRGPAAIGGSEPPLFDGDGFNPAGLDAGRLSEAQWEEWRRVVRGHELHHLPLGRLTPSLRGLPSVIWNTPLGYYLDHSLASMRELRTHGEKRVRAVLEVFAGVYAHLRAAPPRSYLATRLSARFVPVVEGWFQAVQDRAAPADWEETRARLAEPILDQIQRDGGDVLREVAAGRWGLTGAPLSVHAQARVLKVTRARVYQLLEECGQMLRVRWPEGARALLEFEADQRGKNAPENTLDLLVRVRQLCFDPTVADPES